MISWIRKDFEKLDYLLKQQHEEAAKNNGEIDQHSKTFQIDRIVLYIDDLDRCEPAVVVKVLEAIHLLLAFPLFVVVVGVDPRWMENALTTKFDSMLHSGVASGEDKTIVTPKAYLEKIFQIPFALQPVNRTGFQDLVGSQFQSVSSTASRGNISAAQGAFPVQAPGETGNTPVNPAQKQTRKSKRPYPNVIDNSEQRKADLLVISPQEIEFMQSLNFLLPSSPRTIKRFVNIYRIIRSHEKLKFSGQDHLKDYGAVMILLAILIGIPNSWASIFEKITKDSGAENFKVFLDKTNLAINYTQLAPFIKTVDSNIAIAAETDMISFRQNLDLVKRFNF